MKTGITVIEFQKTLMDSKLLRRFKKEYPKNGSHYSYNNRTAHYMRTLGYYKVGSNKAPKGWGSCIITIYKF